MSKDTHISGMYVIIAALIGVAGALGAVLLSNYLDKENTLSETQTESLKVEDKLKEKTKEIVEKEKNTLPQVEEKIEEKPKSKPSAPPTNSVKATNVFVDQRDGEKYKWKVLADGKKWMTENLRYAPADGSLQKAGYSKHAKGQLYSWNFAQKACPSGWHIATDKEWRTLIKIYGGYSSYNNEDGHSSSSCLALIKGGKGDLEIDYHNWYWTGSEFWDSYHKRNDSFRGRYYQFGTRKNPSIYRRGYDKRSAGMCRCIEDD